MKSVIQNRKECIVCGSWTCESHYIFHDVDNKNDLGLTVWLCPTHLKGTNGIYGRFGHKLDFELKQLGQKAFEWTRTREEFIERFGENYLCKEIYTKEQNTETQK